ncbi:Complement control module protein [Phytophthora megakarya]|uniref:Complement control module protein n=1 Tax=Phytophthora megakarya TaxID=4795 RepID=A0A225VT29_9STRA|nr:Complement control module protein [Phytophthora megakarya]
MRLLRVVAIAVGTLSTFATSVDAGNLRGSINMPTANCGAPVSIYQGSVRYSNTTPGSTATYSCMKGTQLKGPGTIRCTNQGTWAPQPPECRVTYLRSKDNTYRNHDTGYALYSG